MMGIKNFFELIVWGILFIIFFACDGYIYNIPIFDIMEFICIPVLFFTGINSIKANKKIDGFIKILISILLIIMYARKFS